VTSPRIGRAEAEASTLAAVADSPAVAAIAAAVGSPVAAADFQVVATLKILMKSLAGRRRGAISSWLRIT